MPSQIQNLISNSISVKQQLLGDEKLVAIIKKCIDTITAAFKSGNKVLFCGNGGSAADAQHLAAEFSGRFYIDRPALPAEALHCNTSYLTAVANDYSYDLIYARLLQGIGNTVDAQYGSNNACYIQRITSSWSLPCPYSWNNPPTVTSANRVVIPQSVTSNDDNIIQITQLVKDMVTNGNNGFLIKLQNEVTYNIRQYTASYSTNTAEHPKLVIYYH